MEALPGLAVVRGGTRELPPAAYSEGRRQWFAPTLLEELRPWGAHALWLVEGDLYAEGLNFVFGLALRGSSAVVSTARLPDDPMVRKEAIHETGHLLGLSHCDHDCVMRFSHDLPHALRKPSTFCPRCRQTLAPVLG